MSRKSPMSPVRSDEAEPEGRVIVIGWQVVALPILVVLVVAAGYLAGSRMAGRGISQAAAPAAAVAVATLPDGSLYQVPVGADQVPGAADSLQGLTSQFDPNVVYELPRRPHALLGQPAPDFTMQLLGSGEDVSLSDYAGRPVVLDFWATWCPPCRYEMPWFQAVGDKYADDGLAVLAFDVGEKVAPEMVVPTIQAFVSSYGLTLPVLYGQQEPNLQVQREYQVMGYPTSFFIDRSGTVVDFHQGMFPNQVTLESRLQAILAESPAAP